MSDVADGPRGEELCAPDAQEIMLAHRAERAAYAELGRMYQCWSDVEGYLHFGIATTEDPLEACLRAQAACEEAFEACDLACFEEERIQQWRRRHEALKADQTPKRMVKELIAQHKEHSCKPKT